MRAAIQMSLLSIRFAVFFPILLLFYYIFPGRYQWIILLFGSVFFYSFSGFKGLLLLFVCIISTFFAGRLITASNSKVFRKVILALAVSINLLLLTVLKMYNYYGELFFRLIRSENALSFQGINFVVPLGVSYYTLQGIAYVVDIYRGEDVVENNFFRYALFISYFPLITQGPIARFSQLKDQLYTSHPYRYRNLAHGAQLSLWGIFKKLVIADRLNIIVSAIFSEPKCGSISAFGGLMYYIQLYADFSGCMDLISGYSEMLGISLPNNFLYPFSAVSVKDFWRRWHISLSSWLRDYVYIPLGGNRKGLIRKYLNLLITFFISGLWHGGTLGYLAWGLLHGIYQILEDWLAPTFSKLIDFMGTDKSSEGYQALKKLFTIILVSFAWILFRANGLASGLNMIRLIFTDFNFSMLINNIYSFGVSETYTWFLLVAIVWMFFIEKLHKKIHIRDFLDRQPLPVRWLAYLSAILVIVLMGKYGLDGTSMFQYAYF